MRVAVTARAPSIEAGIDRCFGRAYWYLVFDTERKEWFAVDNSEIRNVLGNAGLMAVRLLEEHRVDVVLTGETGPKAFSCLVNAGMVVFHGAHGTVAQTLQRWSADELPRAECANGPGNPFCLAEQIEPQNYLPAEPRLEISWGRTVGGLL